MEFNPYAAPESQVLPSPVETEAEVIRKAHIETEATIKTVGILFFLGAALTFIVGVTSFVAPRSGLDPTYDAVVLTGLGLLQGVTAYGMRGLKRWSRIPACLFCGLALLGFPVGTLFGAYMLVKLLGKQGRFILTEEYRQIIAATPHVKRKTSIVIKVLLALLLIILGIGVLAAILMK